MTRSGHSWVVTRITAQTKKRRLLAEGSFYRSPQADPPPHQPRSHSDNFEEEPDAQSVPKISLVYTLWATSLRSEDQRLATISSLTRLNSARSRMTLEPMNDSSARTGS